MSKRIEVLPYEDKDGGWRWRLRIGNKLNAGVSGESFASKGNCLRACHRLAELIPGAVVVDPKAQDRSPGPS